MQILTEKLLNYAIKCFWLQFCKNILITFISTMFLLLKQSDSPMKNIILFVCFIFFSYALSAQNQVRIDSLMTELNKLKNDTSKVNVLNDLTFEYHNFQPNKAIEYAQMAMELSQEIQFDRGLAKGLRYTGMAYLNKQDYIKAKKHFFLALAMEERNNNEWGVAQCMKEIGNVYKQRGDYKQALDKYKRAVEIFEKLKVKRGTAEVLSNIADAYYKLAKYKNALQFARQSFDIARETGTNEGIQISSLILSESYASIGNFTQAYKFRILHDKLKDSIFRVEKTLEIASIEERFAREKKLAMEKMQNERQAEIDKRNQQSRDNIQYSLIFFIFIMLIAGTVFLGKIDIPTSYIETLIFLTSLLIIRFVIIMLTPYVEVYFDNSPIVALSINVAMALIFLPLHRLLERNLKKKAIEEVSEEEKIKIKPKLKERINKLKEKLITDKDDE